MTQPSVLVEGVSKKFGLTLKSALKYGLADSMRRITGRPTNQNLRSGEFWALQNVNFSLQPGDALGIMGVNGSGKTTLLRILNGTYSPDTGKVTLRGRMGALIAAGAGFSPMLSGRENIYISGTLLGMSPEHIRQKFDEIVAFAELAEFIDMPVRNYSSGMSVRLGFAIAVIGTPEILLVDEVLAVGDISFQKKCFQKVQHMRTLGTTILLVSHAPGAVWAVCNKGMLIHRGHTEGIVTTEEAIRAYDHANMRARSESDTDEKSTGKFLADYGETRGGSGDVVITATEILDDSGRVISEIEYGKTFVIRHHVTAAQAISNLIVRLQINSEVTKGIAIIDSYEAMAHCMEMAEGMHVIEITVKTPNLRPGVYYFGPSLLQKDVGVHLYFDLNAASLLVTHPPNIFFYADPNASTHLESRFSVSTNHQQP
jgi:lipopolysaccharide transport system ATP-binding protein